MGKVAVNRGQARAMVQLETRDQLVGVGRTLMDLCKDECPVRTGHLRGSHHLERVSDEEIHIVAEAPYSLHVFDGDGPGGARRPNRWMLRAIDRARV